jgi:hypothetical protein
MMQLYMHIQANLKTFFTPNSKNGKGGNTPTGLIVDRIEPRDINQVAGSFHVHTKFESACSKPHYGGMPEGLRSRAGRD